MTDEQDARVEAAIRALERAAALTEVEAAYQLLDAALTPVLHGERLDPVALARGMAALAALRTPEVGT